MRYFDTGVLLKLDLPEPRRRRSRRGPPMPVHGGRLRLAREVFHFLHGFAVTGDDDGLDCDVFALEVGDHFVAPRATGLEVKDG